MIKMMKTFNDFTELVRELEDLEMDNIDIIDSYLKKTPPDDEGWCYFGLLDHVMHEVFNNPPGYFNTQYPNCATFTVSNNYFSYTKNNIGFGVNTYLKRDCIEYTLSIIFNDDIAIVSRNPIYCAAKDREYKEVEIAKKPRKSFDKKQ